uniref:Uncharacterized protein n=1 Tax=Oryza glumipatula TaxID=40148 RepID=A0A0E0AYS3_9ORYZ
MGTRWRGAVAAGSGGGGEVAAVDEHLGEGHVAALGEERGKLREEGQVHGEVSLVDGSAEPPQDGAHGVTVLVGPADDAKRRVVEQHPRPLAVAELAPNGGRRCPAGWRLRRTRSAHAATRMRWKTCGGDGEGEDSAACSGWSVPSGTSRTNLNDP